MSFVKRIFSRNLRQSGIFIALALIIVLFQFLTDGHLLRPQNINNLIMQTSYVLILAIGMVIVIIAGHIDLSVGSVVAFVGALSGVFIVQMGLPWWLGILLSLIVGALVGAWQGYWIAFVEIPAFIVTLAGMLIFRGLTMVVLGNAQISPFPEEFRAIGSGFVPDIFNGSELNILTVVVGFLGGILLVIQQYKARRDRQKYHLEVDPMWWFAIKMLILVAAIGAFSILLANYNGMPVVLIILAALILFYSMVMKRSIIGRHTYALGGNLAAARLSGIKTKWVSFWIFVNMGVLSAIAGLVFTSRLNMAGPKAGVGFELDAIAAAFIGGAAVTGGIGTVVGAVIGALIMGVMNNGMSIMGIQIDWQQAIKGFLLLLAVAFDMYNKKKGGSRTG